MLKSKGERQGKRPGKTPTAKGANGELAAQMRAPSDQKIGRDLGPRAKDKGVLVVSGQAKYTLVPILAQSLRAPNPRLCTARIIIKKKLRSVSQGRGQGQRGGKFLKGPWGPPGGQPSGHALVVRHQFQTPFPPPESLRALLGLGRPPKPEGHASRLATTSLWFRFAEVVHFGLEFFCFFSAEGYPGCECLPFLRQACRIHGQEM